MALARVQVTMLGSSGLPEDSFVNTLHWNGDGLPDWETWAGDLADAVRGAYVTLGGTVPFYPNGTVSRGFQVRVYNPEDEGGPPVIVSGTLPSRAESPMPTECAAVLSFFSESNRPRRRGRIYLGPLTFAALPTGQARFDTVVRTALTTFAQQLEAFGGSSYAWSVYSRADDVHYPITGGWIDNAPDTQRRRGLASTVRTTWAPL